MSAGPHPGRGALSRIRHNVAAIWTLRLIGLSAIVNGVGFGAFAIPAMWYLARNHRVWNAFGLPTYGRGPFETHGLPTTVPVQLAFLLACIVLAGGGALLLVPRPIGVLVTVDGIVICAPFWWGFNLPGGWLMGLVTGALLLGLVTSLWLLERLGVTLAGPPSPSVAP